MVGTWSGNAGLVRSTAAGAESNRARVGFHTDNDLLEVGPPKRHYVFVVWEYGFGAVIFIGYFLPIKG
ncbi:MAG: hypothetical protein OSB75_13850 [Dehalococcoidia bacterium]|nr:hypothetical protein [Dehalococcoidia bacterium]